MLKLPFLFRGGFKSKLTNIIFIKLNFEGLTLNNAVGVAVRENFVKTELKEDYAYVAVSGSSIVGDNSGDNWVSN